LYVKNQRKQNDKQERKEVDHKAKQYKKLLKAITEGMPVSIPVDMVNYAAALNVDLQKKAIEAGNNTVTFEKAIVNPAIANPAIANPAIVNPAITNSAIVNPAIIREITNVLSRASVEEID
jgi:hypothetical protein